MPQETDLYLPIKQYFSQKGFEVRGEVRDCDLAAIKDDKLILVELKTAVNLELILQGNERKRLCDAVYLGVFLPESPCTSRWRRILRLCRALGLGLLTVSPFGYVQPLLHPVVRLPPKSSKDLQLLLMELSKRSGDYNKGGSPSKPLVTAYRERALRIAHHISDSSHRLKDIVSSTAIADAPKILQNNFYGWFQREKRGVYSLTDAGRQGLTDYAEVLEGW